MGYIQMIQAFSWAPVYSVAIPSVVLWILWPIDNPPPVTTHPWLTNWSGGLNFPEVLLDLTTMHPQDRVVVAERESFRIVYPPVQGFPNSDWRIEYISNLRLSGLASGKMCQDDSSGSSWNRLIDCSFPCKPPYWSGYLLFRSPDARGTWCALSTVPMRFWFSF